MTHSFPSRRSSDLPDVVTQPLQAASIRRSLDRGEFTNNQVIALPEALEQDVVLATEIVVKRGLRYAELSGDIGHADTMGDVRKEHVGGRKQERRFLGCPLPRAP